MGKLMTAKQKILAVMKPNQVYYALDLMNVTGTGAGSIYKALERLEAKGIVESKWDGARQPRRLYYLKPTDG